MNTARRLKERASRNVDEKKARQVTPSIGQMFYSAPYSKVPNRHRGRHGKAHGTVEYNKYHPRPDGLAGDKLRKKAGNGRVGIRHA